MLGADEISLKNTVDTFLTWQKVAIGAVSVLTSVIAWSGYQLNATVNRLDSTLRQVQVHLARGEERSNRSEKDIEFLRQRFEELTRRINKVERTR